MTEAVAMLFEIASALAAATAAWQAQFTLAMAEEAACRPQRARRLLLWDCHLGPGHQAC